jgi:ADP-ribose pyrophosphatase
MGIIEQQPESPKVIFESKRLWVEEVPQNIKGVTHQRIIIHPGNAVAILPIMDNGDCILVKQDRIAVGEDVYEVPAGMIDKGESPIIAARRELIEETGYDAVLYIPHGFIYTSPGYTDEKIHLFEARHLFKSDKYKPDGGEVITKIIITQSDLLNEVVKGNINDAKTMILALKFNKLAE